jgi:hypothetical protein
VHSEKSEAEEKAKGRSPEQEATLAAGDRKLAEELDLPLPHILSDADSEAISELIRTSVLEASYVYLSPIRKGSGQLTAIICADAPTKRAGLCCSQALGLLEHRAGLFGRAYWLRAVQVATSY